MDKAAYGWWLPVNISTQGAGVDRILLALHWFMAFLFVGWGIFFIYCLIRFRRREGHAATYRPIRANASKYIEAGVVLFEAILLVGFSMPVWASFKKGFPDEKEALVLRVVAEQFAWNIHYPGADGQFGRTQPRFVTSSNLLGLDPDDPNGKDDFNAINQLHFPVGKPIILKLTSKDVVHSFKVPVMRITQDVIPGTEIRIWFQADRTGEYELACAQLCGIGHYRMRGVVSVDTPETFERWIGERQKEASGAANEY